MYECVHACVLCEHGCECVYAEGRGREEDENAPVEGTRAKAAPPRVAGAADGPGLELGDEAKYGRVGFFVGEPERVGDIVAAGGAEELAPSLIALSLPFPPPPSPPSLVVVWPSLLLSSSSWNPG